MGSVFAMQGLGQFGAGIIALIVTAGFKDSLSSAVDTAHCTGICGSAVDKMWRVIIGFGGKILLVTIPMPTVWGCLRILQRLASRYASA